jgi:hypothetical protein
MAWDSKRGTWAPPAVVSTLPVMSTTAGNARDPDHVIPSLLPPGQLPRPASAIDRSPMSGAFPPASLNRKLAAPSELNQRIWTPPAVSTLPLTATAAGNYQDPDFTIPNLLPQLPPPRAPRAVDRSSMPGAFPTASPDRKAAVASDLDQRIWAPPAVTTLPISAAIRAAR